MDKMVKLMTISKFKKILPKICGKDTSYDPKGWMKNNPFWGHCAVVALLAHSLFAGVIWFVNLKGTKFAKMKFHFWNVFPNGVAYDFTRSQFGKEYPGELEIMSVEAGSLLKDKSTLRRFNLLRERFEDECKKNGWL